MFIVRADITPNPHTLKFHLPATGLTETINFDNPRQTDASPLAKKIFGFPWTKQITLGPDFMSLTKHDWVDWDILQEPLTQLIQEHIDEGYPIWQKVETERDVQASDSLSVLPGDDELTAQLKNFLQEYVRPVLQMDGGDLRWIKLENSVLYLQLKGSCSSCPSSQITLKEGIESRIKNQFPEIQSVEAI
jgi:Fe-S cluster biogenesis protein NfuA